VSAARTAIDRIAAAVAVVAFVVARSVHRLGDFDLPWHLAFGRIVVATRSVPRVDDLAYTHRPIQHAEFVSDALLYLVQREGGALALQVTGALVAALAFVVAWHPVRRRGAMAILVASAAAAAATPWLLSRPATFSFLLLAVEMALLRIHRADPDGRRGRRALAALAPLFVLWANMHGFVVVGVAIAIGYLACRAAAKLARGRAAALLPPDDARGLGFAAIAVAAAVLGACINMAGPRLFLGPAVASRDFGHVTEWMRPTLSFLFVEHPASGVFLVLTLLAMAFGRDPDRSRRAPTLFDLGVVVVALALAAGAVRLIAVASVLLLPIVAERLSAIVPSSMAMRASSAMAALLVAPLAMIGADTPIGVGFEPSHFPEGAVRFIERERPSGNMFNFAAFGGYLAWRLYPQYRVLIDGRTGWVHDPALARRVYEAESSPRAFDALARDLNLQWAVCRAHEGERFCLPPAASRAWAMVYWDDASAIYVRRGGENERMAEHRYAIVTHRTTPDEMLAIALDGGARADALAHDADLAQAQAQDAASVRAAFLGACAAIARRDLAAYEQSRRALVDRAPAPPLVDAIDEAWRLAHSGAGTP
jgi:hypothetical protein